MATTLTIIRTLITIIQKWFNKMKHLVINGLRTKIPITAQFKKYMPILKNLHISIIPDENSDKVRIVMTIPKTYYKASFNDMCPCYNPTDSETPLRDSLEYLENWFNAEYINTGVFIEILQEISEDLELLNTIHDEMLK